MELWLPGVRHSCHYHPNHYRFWPHHSHSIHRNYRYQHIFPVLNGTHGKSTIKTEQQVTPIWQKLPRPPVKDVNADFFTVCAVLATHKINGWKCEKKIYFVCVCDDFVSVFFKVICCFWELQLAQARMLHLYHHLTITTSTKSIKITYTALHTLSGPRQRINTLF